MKKLLFFLSISIGMTHVAPSYAQTKQQSTTRKAINAAVKFIRRKPLTQEEKDLLKKVSISAALATAVAAITGGSAAVIKRKLEEEKRRTEKETKEKEVPQKGVTPSTPKQEKPIEMPAEKTEWSWKQISSGNWDTPFLMFIFQQNEAPLKQLYCDYHYRVDVLKRHISLQGLERGLEAAKESNFEVGKRVADYFIHRYKSSDVNIPIRQRPQFSLKARHLKEEMDRLIRCY